METQVWNGSSEAAKFAKEANPECTSSHEHTKTTTTSRRNGLPR